MSIPQDSSPVKRESDRRTHYAHPEALRLHQRGLPDAEIVSKIFDPRHLADCQVGSGLNDQTLLSAGWSSISYLVARANLNRTFAFPHIGRCLEIPYVDPWTGQVALNRYKPDQPRHIDGKPIKYEHPRNQPSRLYVPPSAREVVIGRSKGLDKREGILYITEGEKKALKACQEGFPCVALPGVWLFGDKRPTNHEGRKVGRIWLMPDLERIEWCGLEVVIVFDSDAETNQSVQHAERILAELLEQKGARVRILRLPGDNYRPFARDIPGVDDQTPEEEDFRIDPPKPAKVGLDDFLVRFGADEFRYGLLYPHRGQRGLFDQFPTEFADRGEGLLPVSVPLQKEEYKRKLATKPHEDQLSNLFNVFQRCPRKENFQRHLEKIDCPREQAVFRHSCNAWHCPACSERRKQAWAESLHRGLQAHNIRKVHVLTASEAEFVALQARVQRDAGKYFSVVHGPSAESVTILATVPLPGSCELDRKEGFERILEAMRGIGNSNRKPGERGYDPVSCSRRWIPTPQNPRKWKDRGSVPIPLATVLQNVENEEDRRGTVETHRYFESFQDGSSIDSGVLFTFKEEVDLESAEDRILGRCVVHHGPNRIDHESRITNYDTKNPLDHLEFEIESRPCVVFATQVDQVQPSPQLDPDLNATPLDAHVDAPAPPPQENDKPSEPTPPEPEKNEPELPPADPCPTCKRRGLDSKRTCWTCGIRICVGCGRDTGSPFIALCVRCGIQQADDDSPPHRCHTGQPLPRVLSDDLRIRQKVHPPSGDEMIYSMTIPGWHPCPLNQLLGHWARAHRLKKADRHIVAVASATAGIPHATRKRRVSIELTLAPRQRASDPDACWKSLLDALVSCGALLDDNRQGVELGQVKYRRGQQRATTVELEDCDS